MRTIEKQRARKKKYQQEHKEEINARNKKYRQEHKDKFKAYYQEHKEKINARRKKYYQKHKDEIRIHRQKHKKKINARDRKYYQEHKEKISARKRKYHQEHKEEYRAYRKKYHQKHKKKLNARERKHRQQNLEEWLQYLPKNPKCQICGRPLAYFNRKNTKDFVCFDHRFGGEQIKGAPTSWLISHLLTPENIKTWESCGFGVLCHLCNLFFPTKNRIKWLKKVNQYMGLIISEKKENK